MGFHLRDDGDEQGVSEINLIPLIDIMLVLMIIFLVTATVLKPSVPLTLPSTDARQQPQTPQSITVQVTANGQIHWSGQPVSPSQLTALMRAAAQQTVRPTLELQVDRNARYDPVAQVLAQASQAGLTDLAFATDSVNPSTAPSSALP